MDYTVLIPARVASTRLPDKPLADIAGKPMVVRVAERASQSGAGRIHVATDDARVLTAVQAHGYSALMTRADHATGTDRLSEAVQQLRLPDDAVVVNVQGDEPLIEPEFIDAVAPCLATSPWADIATFAIRHEVSDNLAIRQVIRYGKTLNDYFVTNPGDGGAAQFVAGEWWMLRGVKSRWSEATTTAFVTERPMPRGPPMVASP